jgi:ABC-type iron transport system FetAB ATPase subunit
MKFMLKNYAYFLCKLCCLISGKILWNRQDLRELDVDELHFKIAGVMQDYTKRTVATPSDRTCLRFSTLA